MKTSLFFLATIAIISSFNTAISADVDYCKFATKKSDFSFFFKGDVIDKCTVSEAQTKSTNEGGYKSNSHTAKLDLSIKNAKGEIRSNKRWIQIVDSGNNDFVVVKNITKK